MARLAILVAGNQYIKLNFLLFLVPELEEAQERQTDIQREATLNASYEWCGQNS